MTAPSAPKSEAVHSVSHQSEADRFDAAKAFATYEDNAAYMALLADDGDCPDLLTALQRANDKLRAEAASHGHVFV